MFGPKIKQIWIIFNHLRLWFAVAKHNLKWLKIQINLFSACSLPAIAISSSKRAKLSFLKYNLLTFYFLELRLSTWETI